jgi:hypothetical protein
VQSNSSLDPSVEIDRLNLDRGTVLSPEDRARIAEVAGDLDSRVKERFSL